jgi:hypothetical protein
MRIAQISATWISLPDGAIERARQKASMPIAFREVLRKIGGRPAKRESKNCERFFVSI